VIHSRITSKAQTTIPRAVREALGLGAGDTLAYEIKDGMVILRRAEALQDPFENPFALFTEWADDLDCEAFANL
jgi:antitoxin PrlF